MLWLDYDRCQSCYAEDEDTNPPPDEQSADREARQAMAMQASNCCPCPAPIVTGGEACP